VPSRQRRLSELVPGPESNRYSLAAEGFVEAVFLSGKRKNFQTGFCFERN
jgi:hypothetical protein